MKFLREGTAATLKLGPFVDDADGYTPETALSIAAADVKLSKNGGTMAAKNSATAPSHDALGYYTAALDATDTGTVGRLEVLCYVSGALHVFDSFMVLPAAVYDSLVAGTDYLQVDAVEVSGASPETSADVADAVLDEARSAHTTAGTLGELVGWLAEMTEDDGGTQRFTANALEQGPSGTGDWTAAEKNQLRHRLGVDGTTAAPSVNSPNLGTVDADVSAIDGNAVTGPDDFKADVSSLATAAALATLQTAVNNILADTGTDGVVVRAADITSVVNGVWGKTLAELAQGKPGSTPDAATALALLYMALRNKVTVDSTHIKFYDDAGAVIYKKAIADASGVYTESEMESGP